MTKTQASQVVGGLGKPSKMPGKSYGLSPNRCKTGSKLAQVEGTPCNRCYARQGNYVFNNVKDSHERRYQSLSNPQWEEAMITLLQPEQWFRWHDSGDIQNLEHLQKIVNVCNETPNTNHWIPTQERGILKQYKGNIPDNLCIRVSSPKIGQKLEGYKNTSMVLLPGQPIPQGVTECKASYQGNKCKDCRACWDKSVSCIGYHSHSRELKSLITIQKKG